MTKQILGCICLHRVVGRGSNLKNPSKLVLCIVQHAVIGGLALGAQAVVPKILE